MPEIKFPEVRFPEIKLPDSLRDMNREDIQKAMSDVRLPDVKLPTRSEIAKTRADIAKSVEKALPTRPGPSPVPFAVLAMLGGLVVGWILATSPMTGPRISAAMGGVRQKIDEWRSGADGDLDTESDSFRDAYRSPSTADTYSGSAGSEKTVGVGPGRFAGTATDGATSVGAERVSSERF